MRALIPFLILLYGICAQAKCISDVYTLGASANSFNFKIENQSGNSFDLGSNVGLGFKLGHLLYCPKKKFEIYSHYQVRYFSLAEAKTKSVFSQLQENVFLNSLGSDVRYLLNSRHELLLDLGLRQDYAPVRTEPSQSRILDDLFLNLKILLGYRHFVFSNRTEDFTLSGKLGVLQPLGGGSKQSWVTPENLTSNIFVVLIQLTRFGQTCTCSNHPKKSLRLSYAKTNWD